MAAQGIVRATGDVDFFISSESENVDKDRADAEMLRETFSLEDEP
jgi:hypothetical protein